ncbi:pyridoxamine 5'-phosphate oxidase family protein [Sulfurimonas sp.]
MKKTVNITKEGELLLAKTNTAKLPKNLMAFIQNCSYFFLATASQQAHPNVNFKGGEKGFVHVLDENSLIFPDYNGNGIFHGVNDIIENPNVAMLFIDFTRDMRYKVNGIATIIDDEKIMKKYIAFKGFDYATRVIKVDITYVLGNCSKHLKNVRQEILAFTRE